MLPWGFEGNRHPLIGVEFCNGILRRLQLCPAESGGATDSGFIVRVSDLPDPPSQVTTERLWDEPGGRAVSEISGEWAPGKN